MLVGSITSSFWMKKDPGRGSHLFCTQWVCAVMSELFATPWTVAHQAPLSREFSRQEYWKWNEMKWQSCHFLRQGKSSKSRDRTCASCVSCIGRQILYHWATWEARSVHRLISKDPLVPSKPICCFLLHSFKNTHTVFLNPWMSTESPWPDATSVQNFDLGSFISAN